ncbi:major facilitator superfamily domain-containing protein [Corynascus similis CBS 632.67]
MPFLVLLAKLAKFTDVFLSGLAFPVIPTILQIRTLPYQQDHPEALQIWTSVLVSAYGGGFAVASPLMPLLTRQGPTGFVVLLAGLACTAAAYALLQFSSDLLLLILARALQGFAAAAITGASSGLLATAQGAGHTWFSAAFLQSAAMTIAPFVAGLLHDSYSLDAVFYCAYALVALNILLSLLAASTRAAVLAGSSNETAALLESETQPGGYGTMPSRSGSLSGRSSRSISPTSMPVRRSQRSAPAAFVAASPWSLRLWVAFGGYLVVGLLTSALQSVLPLFVQRQFEWSVLGSGAVFVPLSAPAAVVGFLSGALAARVPRSTRFLATIGFLACTPAFLHLGHLTENTKTTHHGFLLTLSAISFAIGLTADPLTKEMTNASESSTADSWSATVRATVAPSLANAWGSLIGPVLAAAVNYLQGWQSMTKSLAVIAAGAGVIALLFLQSWIGSPHSELRARPAATSFDEESAPLLASGGSNGDAYQRSETYGGKEDRYPRSDGTSSDARHDASRKHRPHRRHFSVDNFSVATTAGPGSVDSSTSSVRFQAALETPVQGSCGGARRRSEACDSASKTSSTERRYVMREAPHAPATDPLLAAGSLYVIDEERDTARGVESQRQKRRVVVFPEGTAPPELLARNRHHIVAINALDGTAQMVSDSTDNHAVHVTEETAEDEAAFQEANSRRYVVVVVEGEDAESE